MQQKLHMMAFNGLLIEISYDDARVSELLDFLLVDLAPEVSEGEGNAVIARYTIARTATGWALSLHGQGLLGEYSNLYDMVLPFFNQTMVKLAQESLSSVCLHAALVSDKAGSILMPGVPGSGKSSASLWLSHLGMHYHSDEMIAVSLDTSEISALTRPYILKKPVINALDASLKLPYDAGIQQGHIFESKWNAWIEHRFINADYQASVPALKAILFPVYTTGDTCCLTELSRAHVALELMRSHFQSQRFEDHGFPFISKLARSVPSYLMVYNHFDQIEGLAAKLMDGL